MRTIQLYSHDSHSIFCVYVTEQTRIWEILLVSWGERERPGACRMF